MASRKVPGVLFAAVLWVALFPSPGGAGDEAGPQVSILSPRGGWTLERIVTITGEAQGAGVRRAVVVINGADKKVAVKEGRFAFKEVVSPGENTIRVLVQDAEGRTASDAVTFYAEVPERDLKITVNWDTDGTDMDLHVKDPEGEVCMYNHKKTKIGGKLDIDVTDGFGPETFTLAGAVPGTYEVYIHYYGPEEGAVTVAEVWIILWEGTPRERKEKREVVLMHQNDRPLVWKFEVE